MRAIAGLDADVIGLMEMQRNGDIATQALVDALNAHLGATVYAAVPEPAAGAGTDAIKVAMIYKPAAVSRVGASLSDSAAIHNRPPLAQTFATPAGARFSVIVNHFKSKGCDGASGADLDQGDGQGCFNARRVAQAQALLAFIGTVKAAAGDDDVLVIGDLNAYSREDPVEALKAAGLVDQLLRLGGGGDYSYVFDGEAGALDHALATASLSAQVVGAVHWHINADEPSVIDYNTDFKSQDLYSASPWRASDHDPVMIGIQASVAPLPQTITFAPPAARRLDQTPFVPTVSASSGLAVTLSSLSPQVCAVAGTSVSLLSAGECSIAADQPGNPTYGPAAQVVRTFTVFAGLVQAIDFAPLPDQPAGSGSRVLSAIASSGLPVVFSSVTPGVCAVAAGVVSWNAAGVCTVMATQAGDANWLPAPAVTRSFTVFTPGGGGTGGDGDAPLPAWALVLLAIGLARGLARKGR